MNKSAVAPTIMVCGHLDQRRAPPDLRSDSMDSGDQAALTARARELMHMAETRSDAKYDQGERLQGLAMDPAG